MLWKHGDHVLKAKDFALAAEWYLLSTHATFGALAESNFPKARRKAALALLHANAAQRAEGIIQSYSNATQCASDFYVLFLAAAMQGEQLKGACLRRADSVLSIC